MAKYKVGDRVRVRSDLKPCVWYGSNMATKDMSEAGGQIVTISQVEGDEYKIEGFSYHWTDEMFYAAPKDLIEVGSIVECRYGTKYIYLNGLFLSSNGEARMDDGGLDDFSDDLIYLGENEYFDIMRIYKSESKKLDDLFNPEYLTPVWERKEPREMTIKEVEKELGYPVKIVKGE